MDNATEIANTTFSGAPETETRSAVITRLCELFSTLSFEQVTLTQFAKVYRSDINFIDPLHSIEGLEALIHYSASLYQNVKSCRFEFEQILESDGQATLVWKMHLVHPKLNGGKLVIVPGVSHVRFDDHVYYHRDYFDAGAMLYEQIPVLREVIAWLKRRLQ